MTDNLDFFDIDLDSDDSEITKSSSTAAKKAPFHNKEAEHNGRNETVRNRNIRNGEYAGVSEIENTENRIEESPDYDIEDRIEDNIRDDVEDDSEDSSAEDMASGKKHSKKHKTSIIKEIISYMLVIAAAFVLAFFTNHFLIVNARIPTGSMIPTIMEGDRIIGNRLAYNHSEPKRGDVIVFYNPDNEEEKYVKRVIGLPGETLRIENGAVYINGQLLDESSYLDVTPYGSYGPYTIPADCYFMMGDNRNSSWDSRFWTNTYVHKDKIIAKAVFCYYPDIHLIK